MKNWRLNLVFLLIICFGAAIIGRLVFIQIIQHEYYKALAQGQKNAFSDIGDRGQIFMSGGQILATNIKGKSAFIEPEEVEDKEATAEQVSKVLNLNKDNILKVLNESIGKIRIKINLTTDEANNLANIKGVYVLDGSFRDYPQKFMASHVIGFLGGEGSGQYGIEGYYDDYLKGKDYINGFEEAKGYDVILTLDYNIQFMAEKIIEDNNLEAKSGQIIVMDPNTGKILAMAAYPNFDPNNYSEAKNLDIFQNPAIQKLFEPGSIFKPITMAAALDQEKITPKTTYIDKGLVKVNNSSKPIYNYGKRSYGEQTMTGVLEKSINTGAVFAEAQVGNSLFWEYISRFGFFNPTGIDLQGEEYSSNQTLKKESETNLATASFGQGIEITPIQMMRAFSAIANGGKLVKPYIVEKMVKEGETIETKPEIQGTQVVSSKTVSQLTAMLISVVENGYAKTAQIPGYYVAGKTGTAQVSWSALNINKAGYSDETWQSFIGFAPAFSPKFLIMVKLDNPKSSSSEYSAAPLFQKLAEYIIDYQQIPPDNEQ